MRSLLNPEYILGTVHKAKGLEFDTVHVLDDFVKVPCARHNLAQLPHFRVGETRLCAACPRGSLVVCFLLGVEASWHDPSRRKAKTPPSSQGAGAAVLFQLRVFHHRCWLPSLTEL